MASTNDHNLGMKLPIDSKQKPSCFFQQDLYMFNGVIQCLREIKTKKDEFSM